MDKLFFCFQPFGCSKKNIDKGNVIVIFKLKKKKSWSQFYCLILLKYWSTSLDVIHVAEREKEGKWWKRERSPMKMLNEMGPSTDPWGSPLVTASNQTVPLMITLWALPVGHLTHLSFFYEEAQIIEIQLLYAFLFMYLNLRIYLQTVIFSSRVASLCYLIRMAHFFSSSSFVECNLTVEHLALWLWADLGKTVNVQSHLVPKMWNSINKHFIFLCYVLYVPWETLLKPQYNFCTKFLGAFFLF